MITLNAVSKRYGDRLAVDDLSFTVRPGRVTGFLGPNGSGKSTTMRLILGLDAPTAGHALVDGRPYTEHAAPLRKVGALLEARGVHPGRTARSHLRVLAATHDFARSRIDEVLEMVGLSDAADRRSGGFSLGMSQRLGIASALLGDPEIVMLDEPVNGLDPDGVQWIRRLLRGLADEGRTVFVSSHLMSEMALTAQHLVVIGRGRLIADASVDELVARASRELVVVRTPDGRRLRELLAGPDVTVASPEVDLLEVEGASAREIGDLAQRHGLALYEMTPKRASLEEAFMALTHDHVEFDAAEVLR
jgi:ABC-2 type transport system ATP-binding protein